MTFIKSIFILLQLALMSVMAAPLLVSEIDVWWLDNLVSLQLQWMLLAGLLLLVGLRYSRRGFFLIAPFFVCIGLANFGSLYSPFVSEEAGESGFTIAQLNIRYQNPHAVDIFSEIIRADYDIVVIQEISDQMVGDLSRLSAQYPYSMGSTSWKSFSSGNALFSKWPLSKRIIHNLGYAEGRILEAEVTPAGAGKPIRILALHPGAPRSRELWILRNATLGYIAREVVGSARQRQVVVGDLNVSPWSPAFKTLLRKSELVDSSKGFGYIPSWALFTRNFVSRFLSSAYIDHCLVSPSLAVRNKQWQFISGSDHLLVSTALGVR